MSEKTLAAELDGAARSDGLHHVRLRDGRKAVLKRRREAAPDFFAAEARGLAALALPGCIRVPQVYGCDPAFIVLEDLGVGQTDAAFWTSAGRGVAALHLNRTTRFGFEADGYCGDTPQSNRADADGHRFFVERRLLPQTESARNAGLLEPADVRALERLCSRLPQWIPIQPPVLTHGDLWLGNLHCCADGTPALIDGGAAHHGWREAELAMLTLFGEPPPDFWSAYAEVNAIERDWRERVPLYNLYHTLNHLNLFGASYLAAVRSTLRRFV